MQTHELYLDIETMGTGHTAPVWEIGAIVLGPDNAFNSFTTLIDWSEYNTTDFESDVDTMLWIKSKTSVEERWLEATLSGLNPVDALTQFNTFLYKYLPQVRRDREKLTAYSWGNFDFPILNHMSKYYGWQPICHYGSVCDVRAVAKFLGTDIRPDTSNHVALSDAAALIDTVDKIRGMLSSC